MAEKGDMWQGRAGSMAGRNSIRRKLIWVVLGLMSDLGALLADRPMVIDDTEPVAPGVFQFELGGRFAESDKDAWDWPFGLVYGVVPRLEVSVGVGGYLAEVEENLGTDLTSGIGDVTLGAKFKCLNSEELFLDQSLALGVKLPTADRKYGTGETDVSAGWIISKWLLEDRLGLHWNTVYSWVGGNDEDGLSDLLTYGLAADYQLSKPLQLVAETYAITSFGDGTETAVLVNGGLRWFLRPNLVFDAAGGCGVEGPGPHWFATVGLTWVINAGKKAQ